MSASNADSVKSRRPWFRFSLRTALIAMAVLSAAGGYVVHEWRVVKERKAAFDAALPIAFRQSEENRLSHVRRWMGDQEFSHICPVGTMDQRANIARVRAAFPEAIVETDQDRIQALMKQFNAAK